MVEVGDVENIQFEWGKKRRLGGKHKTVQFYESFTFDGVEYMLYDSVYLYQDGFIDPHIGKLIKIWEVLHDKMKKIKVLWFFRPCEISDFLGNEKVDERELFLASGEGVGLANIVPLEAIAGKCNVICVSPDSRNAQLSDEELQMADFLFYRTFDVEKCVILDKIDDKIAGIEVELLFNRGGSQKSSILKLDSGEKEVVGNVVSINKSMNLSKEGTSGECETLKLTSGFVDTSMGESGEAKSLMVGQYSSLKENPTSCVGEEQQVILAKASYKQGNVLSGKSTPKFQVRGNVATKDTFQQKSFVGEFTSSVAVQLDEAAIIDDGNVSSSKPNSRPQLKEMVEQKMPIGENHVSPTGEKLIETPKSSGQGSISNDKVVLRSKDDSIQSENKVGKCTINRSGRESISNDKVVSRLEDNSTISENKVGKYPVDHAQFEEKVKGIEHSCEVDDRSLKKAKIDRFDNKNKKSVNDVASTMFRTSYALEEKRKAKLVVEDHEGIGNGRSKKPRLDGNLTKLGDVLPRQIDNHPYRRSKLDEKRVKDAIEDPSRIDCLSVKQPKHDEKFMKLKASPRQASDKSNKTDKVIEVAQRPEVDKSRWFKLPWSERMRSAHEEGKLILLQNLNPSYTSAEVVKIVSDAFNESCMAKMIQRTAFSNPHSGKAYVIFNKKEVAEKVVTKLDEGCLMLPNGRPLVGSFATPSLEKRSTFFGHLVIDSPRLQSQREMKDAVSTSHCSQPNTIEYEMAMEWLRLQEISDLEWKMLYEQQGGDLRKFTATLKSK